MTSTSSAPAASASAPSTPSLRGRTQKMVGLRKIIAQRMVESLRVSAQLTSVVEVDLTEIAELRKRTKADFEVREGVKLSFLPFLVKAALEGLQEHPKVNATIDPTSAEITTTPSTWV
jgi:pyruvate dehydrogenase E2 component (dihydrolipoamide acetyltransferase)